MIWAAILTGAAAGFGLVLLVAEFLPRQPKLSAAITNLGITAPTDPTNTFRARATRLMNSGPLRLLAVRDEDLELMATSRSEHAVKQVLMGILGLALPILLTAFLVFVAGLPAPAFLFSVPLALAACLIMVWATNLTVTTQAADARKDFGRAVATYIELVAAERKRNTGASRALERASEVADSWVFLRIRELLRLAHFKSQRPWDALRELGNDIEVKELTELADIMRLAGAEGASVYQPLRARGKGLRVKMLNEDRAKANSDSERITLPMSLMGFILLVLLVTPPLVKLMGA